MKKEEKVRRLTAYCSDVGSCEKCAIYANTVARAICERTGFGDMAERTLDMLMNLVANSGYIEFVKDNDPTITRENVLEEAKKMVTGQREREYGTPENNFTRIANLWSAYFGYEFSPADVASAMALMKLARIRAGGTVDSYVDLAGYAACGAEIAFGGHDHD